LAASGPSGAAGGSRWTVGLKRAVGGPSGAAGGLTGRDRRTAGTRDRQAVQEGRPVAVRPGRPAGPEDRHVENAAKESILSLTETIGVFLIVANGSFMRDLLVYIVHLMEQLTMVVY